MSVAVYTLDLTTRSLFFFYVSSTSSGGLPCAMLANTRVSAYQYVTYIPTLNHQRECLRRPDFFVYSIGGERMSLRENNCVGFRRVRCLVKMFSIYLIFFQHMHIIFIHCRVITFIGRINVYCHFTSWCNFTKPIINVLYCRCIQF